MIVIIGFKAIIAKEPPNFKSVGVNIAISAFLIIGLPSLMSTIQDIAIDFYDGTQTGNNNEGVESLAWGLIQDNTTDLLYVSTIGFSALNEESSVKNNLTPEKIKYANLDALITPKTISDIDNAEVENLAYRLDIDEEGKQIASEIEGGAF
ncbi:hypothetical protein, partial [Cellulomonas biazotea]|uniref:hypothetical protein n=1 Tax=Cellulomonas biazotea TaxID=1709 RepID=UPI00366E5265